MALKKLTIDEQERTVTIVMDLEADALVVRKDAGCVHQEYANRGDARRQAGDRRGERVYKTRRPRPRPRRTRWPRFSLGGLCGLPRV